MVSAFLAVMAFVTLIFFLVKISQFNLKKQYKTILFFFVSLAEMLWLGWVGITWNGRFTLGFMGAVCVAWFLINLVYVYLHKRRVVSRWNVAYTAWKSGGSAEDYMKEMEQCEAEIKNDTGIMLVYGGIPLNDLFRYIKSTCWKKCNGIRSVLPCWKVFSPKSKIRKWRKPFRK